MVDAPGCHVALFGSGPVVFLDGVYREDGAELTWQALRHLQTRQVGEVLERAVRRHRAAK